MQYIYYWIGVQNPSISNFWKVDQNPPHLPGGHFPIVEIGVVVPLDGGQVAIEWDEGWRSQALRFRSIQTRRNSQVAKLIKNVMSFAINWVMRAKEHSCVRIVQFHGDTAWCVAMAGGIDQVYSVIPSCVSPARWIFTEGTLSHHVLYLEVSCYLMDTVY